MGFAGFSQHALYPAVSETVCATGIWAPAMPVGSKPVLKAVAIGLPVLGVHVMLRPSLFLAAPWGVVLAGSFRR